jgi:KaiC/GvpD/RAD55 family RecA-like ATPase
MFEGASCTVNSEEPAGTGVPGLDDILGGGLSRGRVFLLEGLPGTGKTTVAMQFLLEGARNGEKVLYLTLSESEKSCAPPPQRTGGRSTASRSSS